MTPAVMRERSIPFRLWSVPMVKQAQATSDAKSWLRDSCRPKPVPDKPTQTAKRIQV